jgi:O-antigen/teichoic acid export membrane protein
MLTGRIVRTLFGYKMHDWRPRFTLSAWRDLIGFSLWSWAVSLAELMRDRMDMFVLGRVLTPTAVGVYAIGDEIAFLPSTEIVMPLCRACFSAFSAARRAGQGVEEAFMRPISTAFLITFPSGLGISLVADPLVRLTMGERWLPAIPIIELLGVLGAFLVFGLVASTMLSAHAMLRRQFGITAICLGVRFLLLIILVNHFGILGAAIGCFIGVILEHTMFFVVVYRRFDLRVTVLWRQIWRTVAAGLTMAAFLVVTGLGWVQTTGEISQQVRSLAEAVIVGATVYTLVLLVLWWLSGRPQGAEADMLAIVTRLLSRLVGRRLPT